MLVAERRQECEFADCGKFAKQGKLGKWRKSSYFTISRKVVFGLILELDHSECRRVFPIDTDSKIGIIDSVATSV